MKLNHRGQTLVLFVLLLPILLLVLGFLIDTGNLYLEKRKLHQNMEHTITYGLTHLDDTYIKGKMTKQLLLNSEVDDFEIEIENDKITISVTKTVTVLFSFFHNQKIDTFTVKKIGTIVSNQIEIRG